MRENFPHLANFSVDDLVCLLRMYEATGGAFLDRDQQFIDAITDELKNRTPSTTPDEEQS